LLTVTIYVHLFNIKNLKSCLRFEANAFVIFNVTEGVFEGAIKREKIPGECQVVEFLKEKIKLVILEDEEDKIMEVDEQLSRPNSSSTNTSETRVSLFQVAHNFASVEVATPDGRSIS